MSERREVEGSRRRAALAWLDERSGLPSLLERHLLRFRVPVDSGAGLTLGGVLVFALGIQIVTGILLLLYFVPTPELAFESVRALMREVPYGWLIRLTHAHAANVMVAILFVHLFHTAFRGAYKKPRELVWITGCVLFLLVLGAALTGYILPWSQMSYWATTVVTAALQYVPWIGQDLVEFIRGGEFVGPATYRRAFAAHVALIPLLLLVGVAVHLALVRRAGLMARPSRRGKAAAEVQRIPFFPRIALRYAAGIVLLLLVLFITVFYAPNLFFPADSFVPADPFETPPNIKPEWYFLWAYALPQLVPEAVALALQGIAVAALFALPFVDRSPHRHPLDRPWIAASLALVLLALVGLTLVGYWA